MDRVLLGLYLQEFNREYLSTPEDRRQSAKTILCFISHGALIIATGVVLWMLS